MADETQIIEYAHDGTEKKSSLSDEQKGKILKAAAIFTAAAAGVIAGGASVHAMDTHHAAAKPDAAGLHHDDKAHHDAKGHHDKGHHVGHHQPHHVTHDHLGGHHTGHVPSEAAHVAVVQHDAVPTATNVLDTMSEHDAFAIARQEIGPGGIYMYHGKYMSTYTKEEQEQMSSDHKKAFEEATHGKDVSHPNISSADTHEVPLAADHKEAFEAIKHQVVEVEGSKYPMQVVKDHHGKIVYKVDAKGDGSYSTIIKVKDQEHNLLNRLFGHHHHHHAHDAVDTHNTDAVAHDGKQDEHKDANHGKHDDHKTDETSAKDALSHETAKADATHETHDATPAHDAPMHDAPSHDGPAMHDATASAHISHIDDPTAIADHMNTGMDSHMG